MKSFFQEVIIGFSISSLAVIGGVAFVVFSRLFKKHRTKAGSINMGE